MRSLLRSRKAQFFVLSAFIIVSILLLVSRWLEPLSVVDTSFAALAEEPFLFNNIKEKAVTTVSSSRNCDELQFNLDEYKNFIQEFSATKNIKVDFDYEVVQPCVDSILETKIHLSLESPSAFVNSDFVSRKQ